MSEIWRTLPDWEGIYEVSDSGRVRSLDRITSRGRLRGRVLSPGISNGYLTVCLSGDGRRRTAKVHTLVAETFLGPRPADRVVCHGNGDKTDNRLANLRYDSPSENVRDVVRHGRHVQANKTRCPRDHEYTPENTTVRNGARYCRACKATERQRAKVRAA